ncbi:uncharacterized protein LOC126410071 [Nymphaea colorata]|nr:uncharacterized protein LOC126410071 [Nymphaea colorata]
MLWCNVLHARPFRSCLFCFGRCEGASLVHISKLGYFSWLAEGADVHGNQTMTADLAIMALSHYAGPHALDPIRFLVELDGHLCGTMVRRCQQENFRLVSSGCAWKHEGTSLLPENGRLRDLPARCGEAGTDLSFLEKSYTNWLRGGFNKTESM